MWSQFQFGKIVEERGKIDTPITYMTFTDINKTTNHRSPQTIENIKNHDIRHWKSRPWLKTGTKSVAVKPVNGISVNMCNPPPLDNWIFKDNTDITCHLFQIYTGIRLSFYILLMHKYWYLLYDQVFLVINEAQCFIEVKLKSLVSVLFNCHSYITCVSFFH